MNIADLELAAVRLRALADAAEARLRIVRLVAPAMLKVERNFAVALAAVTIDDSDNLVAAAPVAPARKAIGF